MYLQPQTVHQHTLTEITELAAIFGGMLTVAVSARDEGMKLESCPSLLQPPRYIQITPVI